MDFISTTQLDKYEEIIEQINNEFEISECLKKELEKENNNIVVNNLSRSKITSKLSHVAIKVFPNLPELLVLYDDEIQCDMDELHKKYCKLYLFEIYITKALLQKLQDFEWMLNISVKYENVCVSRTKRLSSKAPILEVIPLANTVVDCIAEVNLFLSLENHWMILKLDEVFIDISYHLNTIKRKHKSRNQAKDIQNLTKHYESVAVKEVRKSPILDYQLMFPVDPNDFIKAFLRNCYHSVDLELFTELGSNRTKDFHLTFYHMHEKHVIVFDQRNRLTIKGSYEYLHSLKRHFNGTLPFQKGANELILDLVHKLPSIKRLEDCVIFIEDPTKIYAELRKLWSTHA